MISIPSRKAAKEIFIFIRLFLKIRSGTQNYCARCHSPVAMFVLYSAVFSPLARKRSSSLFGTMKSTVRVVVTSEKHYHAKKNPSSFILLSIAGGSACRFFKAIRIRGLYRTSVDENGPTNIPRTSERRIEDIFPLAKKPFFGIVIHDSS